MSSFRNITPFLILILILLFQINRMFPKDPIIPFMNPLVLLLFLSMLAFLWGRGFSKFSPVIYSFVTLECLIIFFMIEHSLFYSLSSNMFYLIIPLPLLCFAFSYNLSIEKNKSFFPVVTLIMVCIFSFVFCIHRNEGLEEVLRTDSGAYTILYYVPFMFCLKNKLVKTIALTLCLIMVLLSFKRGGIICFIVGLYAYMAICVIKGMDWTQKIKRLFYSIFPLALIVVGLFYINEYYGDFLFKRFSEIQETGGSSRNVIYAHVFEMITNSSWFELLVGHGWNTVLRDNYLGFSAHNDFLECIYDYGIITFIAYLALYINLIRLMLGMLKRNSIYAAPLAASIVMFLSNSLVSHILLYDWHFMSFALFWGYIIACDEQEKVSNATFNKYRHN